MNWTSSNGALFSNFDYIINLLYNFNFLSWNMVLANTCLLYSYDIQWQHGQASFKKNRFEHLIWKMLTILC